ncbi:MAG: zinc permease [Deltaproteobacteria bacterium]
MNRSQLLLMAVPALVALAGGFLAKVWHPSRRARSHIQHFAAGVMLAALAVELLPDIEREHASRWVLLLSFSAGALLMFGLKLLTERLEHRTGDGASSEGAEGLLVATFIDVAVDGVIIGAGFAAGGETGAILAIGLSVELLFLGLSLTTDRPGGWRIVALSGALGATVFLCALAGNWALAGANHHVMAGVLSASVAALLYLVTEELLVEAHREPETPVATLVLFAGFLAFWAVRLWG